METIDEILNEFTIGQSILTSKKTIKDHPFESSYEISKSIDIFSRYIDEILELKKRFNPKLKFDDLFDDIKCDQMMNECKLMIKTLQAMSMHKFQTPIKVRLMYQ